MEIEMNRRTSSGLRYALLLGVSALLGANAASAASSPQPVLLVIANQDFHYAEYAAVRASLEAWKLPVTVAAGETRPAQPQGLGAGLPVQPDLALTQARAGDYSAIVFVGGWGASSYQYAFSGTYHNSAYRAQRSVTQEVNRLINDFIASDKPVAALDHAVTVLAWARVDGVSPLRGRVVVGPAAGAPGHRTTTGIFADGEKSMRGQIEANGALMLNASAMGDPLSASDDVWVDGLVITAENFAAAGRFAEVVAQRVAGAAD
jgi:putative intracellular protease/amidase